jgi:hypothetical protein
MHISGVVGFGDNETGAYCHKCGRPYPWTEARFQTAKLLLDESDLSPEENELLMESLKDLTRESPRMEIAILRVKKLIPKAGKLAFQGLKHLAIDMATEAAKKQLAGF